MTEAKIRYLARRTAEWLAARDGVEVRVDLEVLAGAIARTIRDEMRREDLLDEEVERLLARYKKTIDVEGADPALLRQKIKKQLARDRGIVL